jgi:predicted transcriptional regulator
MCKDNEQTENLEGQKDPDQNNDGSNEDGGEISQNNDGSNGDSEISQNNDGSNGDSEISQNNDGSNEDGGEISQNNDASTTENTENNVLKAAGEISPFVVGRRCRYQLITLSPNAHVEQYKPVVEIPLSEANKENVQTLKQKIREDGRVTPPIFVMPATIRGHIIIDGWTRFKICQELKIDCQALLFEGLEQAEALELFLSANLSQRQMKREVKKEIAFALRRENASHWTNIRIATLLGVDKSAVSKWFNPTPVPPVREHMNKIGTAVDKIRKEIEKFFDQDLRRHTSEHREQAKNALPSLLSKIEKLTEAAEIFEKNLEVPFDNAIFPMLTDATSSEGNKGEKSSPPEAA